MGKVGCLFTAMSAALLCTAVEVDSSSYVSDGLVLQLDGLDNTVANGVRGHADAPTVWSDLSGQGNDVPLYGTGYQTVEASSVLSIAWTNKVADVDYPTFATLNGLDASPSGTPFTVECVMQRVEWTITDNENNLQPVVGTPRGAFGYRKLDAVNGFYLFAPNSESKLRLANGWTGGNLHADEFHTLAATFSTGNWNDNAVSVDGSPLVMEGPALDNYEEGWAKIFKFFSNPRATIRIFAIRIYNRRLTDKEIMRNAELDRIRFLGEPVSFRSLETTLPAVIYQGAPCMPDTTILDPLSGEVLRKGIDYSIAYENNNAPGEATLTVTGLGAYADYGALVKTFTICSAIGTSSSYVSDGLVLHLDGLDNSLNGAERIHGDAVTTWKDLSGQGNDVPLNATWQIIEGNAILSKAGTSKAAGAGYYSTATLNGLTMPTNGSSVCTVELVMQRDRWAFTDNYFNTQAVFGTPRGGVLYRYSDDVDGLILYAPYNSWKRQIHRSQRGIRASEPHTFTVALGWHWNDNALAIDGGALSLDGLGGSDYEEVWASSYSFFSNSRADIRVFAIRAYNRRLTEAEILRNAALDRVRFWAKHIPFVKTRQTQPDEIFHGTPCTPDLPVVDTMTGAALTQNVHYQLEYANNDRPGLATVVAVGLGSYADYAVTNTFRIIQPACYLPIDYIESSGTQWIDTGYLPGPTTKMEADIQFIGTPANRSSVRNGSSPFGCAENGGIRSFSMNFGGSATQDNDLFTWFDRSYLNGAGSPVRSFGISQEQRTSRNVFKTDAATTKVSYGDTVATVCQKFDAHTRNPLVLFGTADTDGCTVPFTLYKMRVYGWKIWNGTTLMLDFQPVLRVDDCALGLLDRVSGRFYPNAGRGTFGRGPILPVAELPPEYRPLERIVTDGNAWLDTGVKASPNTTTTVLCIPCYENKSGLPRRQRFISARSGATSSVGAGELLYEVYANDSAQWACACADGPGDAAATTDGLWSGAGVSVGTNTRYSFTLDGWGNAFYVNGVKKVALAQPRTGTSPANIAVCSGGGVDPNATGNIELVLVWESGRLVRHLVPCYRVADGAAGLYDLVEEEFHPSDGTAPFRHGAGGDVGIASFTALHQQVCCTTGGTYANLTNFSFTAWVHNLDTGTWGWYNDATQVQNYYGVVLGQGALGNNAGFCCSLTYNTNAQTRTLGVQLRNTANQTKEVNFDFSPYYQDGKWHHIAYTCDLGLGEVRLYLDGKEKANCTDATQLVNPASSSAFAIGGRYSDYPMKGEVAQVTLWNRAITADEIEKTRLHPVAGTEEGLIGWWPLDCGGAGLKDGVDRDGVAKHNLSWNIYSGYLPGTIGWHQSGSVILVR